MLVIMHQAVLERGAVGSAGMSGFLGEEALSLLQIPVKQPLQQLLVHTMHSI